jgi:hypothetical protein
MKVPHCLRICAVVRIAVHRVAGWVITELDGASNPVSALSKVGGVDRRSRTRPGECCNPVA